MADEGAKGIDTLFGIKDVASWVGISPQGVRFLERKGIIAVDRNEENGRRQYTHDHGVTLSTIKSYQRMGMSLADAQRTMGNPPAETMRDLERLRARLVEEHEERLRLIDLYAQRIRGIDAALPLTDVSARPVFRFAICEGYELADDEARIDAVGSLSAEKSGWGMLLPEASCGCLLVPAADGSYTYHRCLLMEEGEFIRLFGSETPRGQFGLMDGAQGCLHVIVRHDIDEESAEILLGACGVQSGNPGATRSSEPIVGRVLYFMEAEESTYAITEFWILSEAPR